MVHLQKRYQNFLFLLFIAFVGTVIYTSVTGNAMLESRLPALVMILAVAVGAEPLVRSEKHRYATYGGLLTLLGGLVGFGMITVGWNPLTNPIIAVILIAGVLLAVGDYSDSAVLDSEPPRTGSN